MMAARKRLSALPVLLVLLAAAAVALVPAGARAGAVHSLPATLLKYLGPKADEVAERALKEAATSSAALKVLAGSFDEAGRFVDEAAATVLRKAAGDSDLAEAAAVLARHSDGAAGRAESLTKLKVLVESSGQVHHSIDDVVTGLMIMAKQVSAAEKLGGRAALASFKVPPEAGQLLQVTMKRLRRQKEMLGGVYRDTRGFYLSLSQAEELKPMLDALAARRSVSGMSAAWRARVVAAFDDVAANGDEAASLSRRIVDDASKQGDAAFWRRGGTAAGFVDNRASQHGAVLVDNRPRNALGVRTSSNRPAAAADDQAQAQELLLRRESELRAQRKADQAADQAADEAAERQAKDEAERQAAARKRQALEEEEAAKRKAKADEDAAAKAARERAERAELDNLSPKAAAALKAALKARRRTEKLVAFVGRADRAFGEPYKLWRQRATGVFDSQARRGLRITPEDVNVKTHWDEALARVRRQFEPKEPGTIKWNGARTEVRGSRMRQSPYSKELRDELAGMEAELAHLREANGGRLPAGVRAMSLEEKETLATLNRFFDGQNGYTPVRDWDGYFLPEVDMLRFKVIREGGTEALLKCESGVATWVKEMVTHADNEVGQYLAKHLDLGAIQAHADSFNGRITEWEYLAMTLKEGPSVRRNPYTYYTDSYLANGRESDKILLRLRRGDEWKLSESETTVLSSALDSLDSSTSETSVGLMQALHRNNVMLWEYYGRQWDKPTGAVAKHLVEDAKPLKWD